MWAHVLAAGLGIWLMAAPAVLGYSGIAAHNDHIWPARGHLWHRRVVAMQVARALGECPHRPLVARSSMAARRRGARGEDQQHGGGALLVTLSLVKGSHQALRRRLALTFSDGDDSRVDIDR